MQQETIMAQELAAFHRFLRLRDRSIGQSESLVKATQQRLKRNISVRGSFNPIIGSDFIQPKRFKYNYAMNEADSAVEALQMGPAGGLGQQKPTVSMEAINSSSELPNSSVGPDYTNQLEEIKELIKNRPQQPAPKSPLQNRDWFYKPLFDNGTVTPPIESENVEETQQPGPKSPLQNSLDDDGTVTPLVKSENVEDVEKTLFTPPSKKRSTPPPNQKSYSEVVKSTTSKNSSQSDIPTIEKSSALKIPTLEKVNKKLEYEENEENDQPNIDKDKPNIDKDKPNIDKDKLKDVKMGLYTDVKMADIAPYPSDTRVNKIVNALVSTGINELTDEQKIKLNQLGKDTKGTPKKKLRDATLAIVTANKDKSKDETSKEQVLKFFDNIDDNVFENRMKSIANYVARRKNRDLHRYLKEVDKNKVVLKLKELLTSLKDSEGLKTYLTLIKNKKSKAEIKENTPEHDVEVIVEDKIINQIFNDPLKPFKPNPDLTKSKQSKTRAQKMRRPTNKS